MTNNEVRPKKTANTISFIALIVSIITLLLNLLLNWQSISAGSIETLSPPDYAVIRGLSSYPSDHLVIPIEWNNTTKKNVSIRKPYITLAELDSNNERTGTEYIFLMEGEFPEISMLAFSDYHKISKSFILEAKTLSTKVMLFHIENWWDDSHPNYDFRFKSGDNYAVEIYYEVNLDENHHEHLCNLEFFESIDNLTTRNEDTWWWDHWPTN
ncbi:hypothetical protein KQH50_00425 [bacterium]|nr:hypothetical protein [bacterium]